MSAFDQQLRHLKEEWNVITLDDLMGWYFDEAELPERAIVITFDDGLQDVFRFGMPLLEKYELKSTMFVCPDLLCDEHEKEVAEEPGSQFMTWQQLKTMVDAGWIIGSHSLDHPMLSTLDAEAAKKQIRQSREKLEKELKADCKYFCYPYGTPKAVSARDKQLVGESGYVAGFSSLTGFLSKVDDRYALPRSKVLAKDDYSMFRGILRGQMDPWRFIERRH